MGLGQLAAAEQVRPPTMSRIVAALERQKLIQRANDVYDSRRIRLQATAKGRDLMLRGRRLRIAYLAAQLERLPASQLRALAAAADILEAKLRNWP
jgi:DNA-binding MarR family transcriptional regulator